MGDGSAYILTIVGTVYSPGPAMAMGLMVTYVLFK